MNSAPRRVGLLVVHGIGEQLRGDTLKSVVDGLEEAYGTGRFIREEDRAIGTFHHAASNGFTEPVEVRVYEVYWAKQLPADKVRGSFHMERIHQLVWFPLLNWRSVRNFNSEYRRAHVIAWTVVLLPVAGLVTAAYNGLQIVMGLVQGFADDVRTSDSIRDFHARFTWRSLIDRAVERTRQERPDAPRPRSLLDRFLDDYFGDVFNYVDAAGDAQPVVPEAAEHIYRIFHTSLSRAVHEGCSEIQILAHSLGSVITYHALTTYREHTEALICLEEPQENHPALTHVFTIGSPLEKFRFFWPKLIADRPAPSAARFEWHNFTSPGDLVAGPLQTYAWVPKISNHSIGGAWGLVTAHTGYRKQADFLRIFGPAVTGEEPTDSMRTTQALLRRWLSFFIQTVGIPVGLLVCAVLGGLSIFFSLWIFPRVFAFLVDAAQSSLGLQWTLQDTLAGWASSILGWLALIVTIPWALWAGYSSGKRLHHAYWSTGFVLERRRIVTPSPSVYKNPRMYGIFVAQIALLALIAAVGLGVRPGGPISRSNAFLIILVIMSTFAVLAGRGITGYWRGILIDNRNKMSLSRLQLIAWTLVILSALVTAGLTNVTFSAQSALAIRIPEELWVLLGISTASAIAAPALNAPKREKTADLRELTKTVGELERVDQVNVDTKSQAMLITNESMGDARWGDILKGDESGNAASVDVGKLQMFFFTFVMVLGYTAAIARLFHAPGAVTSLPLVDSSMNTLLGISHTGYLANKVVPHSREAQQSQAPAPAPAAEQQPVQQQQQHQ